MVAKREELIFRRDRLSKANAAMANIQARPRAALRRRRARLALNASAACDRSAKTATCSRCA